MTPRLRRLLRSRRATHRLEWGKPVWRRSVPDGFGGGSFMVVDPPDYLISLRQHGPGLACLSRLGQLALARKVSRRWWIVRYAYCVSTQKPPDATLRR